MDIFTVSQLINYLKILFEMDDHTSDVWLKGEVSNCNRSPNGHIYFRLKDEGAIIECALFRNSAVRQKYLPVNGSSYVMHGHISIYEATGKLQLYVSEVFPDGQGRLSLEFELLKKRLEDEGLFAPERKRPLPERPRVIGVVTSDRAAAYQDILNVLRRRYPLAQVVLSPTLVQGDSAPSQIVAAIQALNARPEVEVIILARGGGSIEELWAFNDERVARAVFASRQPVITGVGHETDYTIVDFVADVRAPTPSAAAEIVSPDILDLRAEVETLEEELHSTFAEYLEQQRNDLAVLQRRLQLASPTVILPQYRQRIGEILSRTQLLLNHKLELARTGVRALDSQLKVLNPGQILERGYAIVSRAETGEVINDISQPKKNETLQVKVKNGEFLVKVP